MPIWILRPYKIETDGSTKLDYEKETIYFSYEILHESVLEIAWKLESEGKSPTWCEIMEYDNVEDGTMEANWIYRPVSGTQMNRWPVCIQI